MVNRLRFRTTFDSQHAKRSETLRKSARQRFYHICWSLCRKLSCEMSLLVIYEILGLFINTMTADYKYFFRNSQNLLQLIQMQLLKEKVFSEFLAAFLKFTSHFEYFGKDMTVIGYMFSKLETAKDRIRQMSKKSIFRTPFHSQHVKGSQRLVKSSWQHFYQIFYQSTGACSLKYLF